MKHTERYLLDLISQGETDNIEFKIRLGNEHNIAAVLTAFANSDGGYLIVGVDDRGRLMGFSENEAAVIKERLLHICKSIFMYPFEIEIVSIEKEAKLATTEHSIKSASDSLPTLKEKLKLENELVDKLNTDIANFNSIRQRETDAIRKQGEFISLQSIIDDWSIHSARIEAIITIITKFAPQKKIYRKKWRSFKLNCLRPKMC